MSTLSVRSWIALRQRGYRITAQRQIVVEILTHTDQHLSAEEIFDQMQARDTR